jgi:hypothetical protein
MAVTLASEYREIRRIAVAGLATDDDPTAGELPPADEWASNGAADALGTIRVCGVYVNGNTQVAGGVWSFRPVEPAVVEGITSLSGVSNALAIYGADITGVAGGSSYLITGIQAGSITFVSTSAGTVPGGATHLVILGRKV